MTHKYDSGKDWSEDEIEQCYLDLEEIARTKFNLDFYTNQIEIINSETMLDAYSAVGMPIYYTHWSFGKSFVNNAEMYKRGMQGLAYEIVINSNPCISYLMEENTMALQALVMAHACFGHNHFFKNNYLFRQWTDAESIIDYLLFAKKYIAECEEKYGIDNVTDIIDSAHALQYHGIDKYKRPRKLSFQEEKDKAAEREEYNRRQLDDLWRTVPVRNAQPEPLSGPGDRFPKEPQENVLYFIEKNAPTMEPWQREIVRIIRKLAQYFYPQMQTQVMNEGFATFTHYNLIQEMYSRGKLTDGFMLEFMQHHTNVVFQPPFDSKYYNGINPYALGFAMYSDIKRICLNPTEEDKRWFPEFAGNPDWIGVTQWAAKNFKDESFISQFLSPKIMRDFRLFVVLDDDRDPMMEISAIHNDSGYKAVRDALSRQYNIGYKIPDIQITNVNRWGDRTMTLRHTMFNNRPLDQKSAISVLKHLERLWGYKIKLESVDAVTGDVKTKFDISNKALLDIFVT
jgi:stage V sporulation protein R